MSDSASVLLIPLAETVDMRNANITEMPARNINSIIDRANHLSRKQVVSQHEPLVPSGILVPREPHLHNLVIEADEVRDIPGIFLEVFVHHSVWREERRIVGERKVGKRHQGLWDVRLQRIVHWVDHQWPGSGAGSIVDPLGDFELKFRRGVRH